MNNDGGAFRFAYFTDKYDETFDFYKSKLGFELKHFWDRNENDKGSLFKAGVGLVEILQRPIDEKDRYPGLDYRPPQGSFMVIQVWNIDELFKKYKAICISFNQEIMDQDWGHRSFSILEPNGILLFFIQEQF